MTKQTEALRMAIEVFDMYGNKMNSAFADEAYQACKAALAETQEPFDAVRIKELEEWVNELIDNRKEFIEALRGMVSSYEYEASSQNPSLLVAKELLKELDK